MKEEKILEKKHTLNGFERTLQQIIIGFAPTSADSKRQRLIRIEGTDIIIAMSVTHEIDGKEHFLPYPLYARPHSEYYEAEEPIADADLMTDDQLVETIGSCYSETISEMEIAEKEGYNCDGWHFKVWRLLPTHLEDKEAAVYAAALKSALADEEIESDEEIEQYLSSRACRMPGRGAFADIKASRDRRCFPASGESVWCHLLDMESVHKVMANL